MLTDSEKKLIDEIKRGNTHAFAELVDIYKDLVFTLSLRMLASREEAEEVAQDTFLKIFNALPKFKGDSKVSTWIYRIAYNTCLDRLRANKKSRVFKDVAELEGIIFKDMDNALDSMIMDERNAMVNACLTQLSSEDAGLLTLFYFEDKSLIEIEKVLDTPVGVLKVRLFRARKRFAKVLKMSFKSEIFQDNG